MTRMLAAVFEGEGKLALKEIPLPEIDNPDDVLIEVEACGICVADMAIMEVPRTHPVNLNTVLGHEYIGYVVEVGSAVTHVSPGTRVAIAPNLACGTCPYCRLGYAAMDCMNLVTLGVHSDGGFAQYNRAPASAVLPISSTLPTEEAVMIESLSCAYAGTSKIRIQPGEPAVVFGADLWGLLLIKILKASGSGRITAAGTSAFWLDYAGQIGADTLVNLEKQDLEAIVRDETEIGVPIVVDAVGRFADMAVRIAAKKARVCLFWFENKARPEVEQSVITQEELEVFGVFVGRKMLPGAIRMLESGVVSVGDLVTHHFPLRDIHQGFAAMKSGKAIKVMITP